LAVYGWIDNGESSIGRWKTTKKKKIRRRIRRRRAGVVNVGWCWRLGSPEPFIAEQVRCQMIVYCESSTGAINQGSDLHWEFELVRKGTEALSFWPVFTSVLVMRFFLISVDGSRYWGIKNVYRVNAGGRKRTFSACSYTAAIRPVASTSTIGRASTSSSRLEDG